MKDTLLETEKVSQQKQKLAQEEAPTVPQAEGRSQVTPTFPLDGESNQQLLLQVLATMLQQAGIGQ